MLRLIRNIRWRLAARDMRRKLSHYSFSKLQIRRRLPHIERYEIDVKGEGGGSVTVLVHKIGKHYHFHLPSGMEIDPEEMQKLMEEFGTSHTA